MSEAKKIYIADDETNIRAGIKTFLTSAGYSVEDFENGDLLLEAFAEKPADLVVLDVMMPGSNGFVVCKELRKKSHVPIIMLTARDSDLDYATGLDLGSDDYLVKPFSPMALVMRIKAIFRRMELDKQTYAELDLLTGLSDKISGINQIESKLAESGNQSLHALMMLDIDSLSGINNKLGRQAGDKVLLSIAEILTGLFDKGDTICRFGGDEFLVFSTDITSVEFAASMAQQICAADKTSSATVSIGLACYPTHGNSYSQLLSCTLAALSVSKEHGGNGYNLYV